MELLAPGGDIDSIKAAIAAGADAIYCGLDKFNARNRAVNMDFAQLNGVLNLAHKNGCKIFLTLNIIITDSEFPALVRLLDKLINTKLDAVIVQDIGLFHLLSEYYPDLEVHASTQFNTHNKGQIGFLKQLSVGRVNLSRELNIGEIKHLSSIAHANDISIEVFVHGSYCISFSGLCYISSVLAGRSGNRGRCSQPCRDRYLETPEGKNFPLNLKDNSAFFDLEELSDAGVDSLKIEGRIKKFDYVYSVVSCWKKHIRSFLENGSSSCDNKDLYKVFNRDFSNSFLKGDILKSMFIDNPRDNSLKQLSNESLYPSKEIMDENRIKFYSEKAETTARIKHEIKQLSTEKTPLTVIISGAPGSPLEVTVKTRENSFSARSKSSLVKSDAVRNNTSIDYYVIMDRLKVLNNTEYYIEQMNLDNLESGLFVPFKEITAIKKRILFILNGEREIAPPAEIPRLKKQNRPEPAQASLSVLISSKEDLYLCQEPSAQIYFQLPACFKNGPAEYAELFLKNKKLRPWFPPVLIGDDYKAAVELLTIAGPEIIVTNNTGIAYEAWRKGINWIAGPFLNIVNSYSLKCLKEQFNCHGSFISSEISLEQIKTLAPPENFRLFYSIYHPIKLLTSRQCLHHQVIGCEKEGIDGNCIHDCIKSSSITSQENVSLYIKKTKGGYHGIYNDKNFLNMEIPTDLPGKFSGFFIDLRDIKTETRVDVDKSDLIRLFANYLDGKHDYKNEITQNIHNTTCKQYEKGI